MDLTQSSETSEHLRQTPPQSDQVEPINTSTDVLGLWQDKEHPPMKSQTTSKTPASRISGEDLIEADKPNLSDQMEDSDQSQITSTLPPSITTIEDVTDSANILQQSAVIDITTPLPDETHKKIGLKSARSLPEDKHRSWPGTFTPDKDQGSSQTGARTVDALPYYGQDFALAQWNNMQKRSGVALPAFDANKWLEALRVQYQIDKNAWPNRVADAARNPRPFHSGTEASQNQFLVVNNRGVVIPNSVQFPEVVKSATFPQLQTYRYPQTSRNIQDILRYVTGSGNNNNAVNVLRQSQWSTPVKKAARVASMYAAPTDNYAANTYVASRPEAAFLAATTASTPSGGKPLNGHAYISDPFHPYKPADPAEINHLADHNPGYADGDFLSYIYPAKSTKQSHLRSHFGNKHAQSTPYTTAIFKPLGNPDQMATSAANVDSLMQYLPQQQKRVLPPLSVMLEIYPMSNEDTRTVPFRGTATSSVFRRPGNSLLQTEPVIRRPVALAVDASVASTQTVMPVVAAPLQFQPQPQLQHQPAFGLTLAGLPPLPGMGPADSKHRMVVHLNFYPKKSPMPVVPRLRDPEEDLQAALSGQADTATAGVFPAEYPQRRQSAMDGRKPTNEDTASHVNGGKGNYFPGNSVVQAEFDASSLANVLPKEVLQRFSDFLRAASSDPEHQTNNDMMNDSGGEYGSDITEDRDDHGVTEDDDEHEEDSEEDDDDDEEEGRIVPYPEEHRRANHRRQPAMMRTPETARVPLQKLWRSGGNVSWSDVQYDDDEDDEDEAIGEVEGREVGDASPKMKIMPGKTKAFAARRKSNETKTPTTSTTSKPETQLEERPERPLKQRRKLIIQSLPKNHRMK